MTTAPSGEPWRTVACNCACQTCLSGRCCMQPTPDWTRPAALGTYTTSNFGWACTSSGHDFMPFPPQAGRDRIFCRKCGEVRDLDKSGRALSAE